MIEVNKRAILGSIGGLAKLVRIRHRAAALTLVARSRYALHDALRYAVNLTF